MSLQIPLSQPAWGKFVAWSALVLAGASLTAIMFYVLVLGLDDFCQLAELQMAGRNPGAYRVGAALDMLNWVGIGALLLAFAGFFGARAPIRALLLAAYGVGQMAGALGGALRLDAITELAARYTTAGPDQQAVLMQVYLTLVQMVALTTRLASCCMAPVIYSLRASPFRMVVCRAGLRPGLRSPALMPLPINCQSSQSVSCCQA